MELLKTFGIHDLSRKTNSRDSVRGIIINEDGTLVMLTSTRYNDCSFPGGGVEQGESDLEALIREVREETGYELDPTSVRDFGQVDLYFEDLIDNAQFHQINRYYYCNGVKMHELSLTEGEAYDGVSVTDISIKDAIELDNRLMNCGYHWIERELYVLNRLKDMRDII